MKMPRHIAIDQKGMTLVELLVAISILAAIMGALSMIVLTMLKLGPLNRDWEAALTHNQNAGYWISRDVQMSRANIDITTNFLTLTVPEWDNASGGVVDRTVEYRLEDIDGGLKKLVRKVIETGRERFIAESIYYNSADPGKSTKIDLPIPDPANEDDPDFWVLRFKITTMTSDKAIVQKEYEAKQRVPPLYNE